MRGEQTPRLREALEEDIVSGRLRPGQRLDEVGLAERFGVSRTPIREALIQLSASGLVEIRPRRGAFVVLLGPRELLESFELTAELEAVCARLAAQRLGSADRLALADAHGACGAAVAAGDIGAYYPANAAFHAAIYAATGNRVIHGEALRLQRALRPYRRLQLNVPRRMEASFAEHEALMAAICAGDGVAAAERARAHVLIQGERFMALLAALQEEAEASAETGAAALA